MGLWRSFLSPDQFGHLKAAVGYGASYAFCSYSAIWTAQKRHLLTLVSCWVGDAPLWAESQQSLSCNFDSTTWSLKTSIMWKTWSLIESVCWKCPRKVWILFPKLKAWSGAEISLNVLSASGEAVGRATPPWEQNRCHGSKGCPNKKIPWAYMNCVWLGLKWGRGGKAPTLVKTGDHKRSLWDSSVHRKRYGELQERSVASAQKRDQFLDPPL